MDQFAYLKSAFQANHHHVEDYLEPMSSLLPYPQMSVSEENRMSGLQKVFDCCYCTNKKVL